MSIKDTNYYTIQGWMINRLKLKGTKLVIYAIIYGFSQNGEAEYSGSIGYLAEFAGVTYACASSNLAELVKDGLICKRQGEAGATNYYKTAQVDFDAYEPSEKEKKPDNSAEITQIIEYLNIKAKTRYSDKSPSSTSPINARLKEGYSLDDFFKVIDSKIAEWGDIEKMAKYLRPQTLFGTKFDGYLNAAKMPKRAENKAINAVENDSSYNLSEFRKKAINQKLQYKKEG